METNHDEDRMNQAADELVKKKHPNLAPEGVWFDTGDTGTRIMFVPDDDQRAVYAYEWNGSSWEYLWLDVYHD